VAGFGIGDRLLHGFTIADFTNHDHVRRFAHGISQCILIAQRIDADLALVDDRLAMLMQILDRILNGEDVSAMMAIAMIEHRGERGRFARTGRADHQDQAARQHHQIAQYRRQSQVFDFRNLGGDVADGNRHFTALPIHVDAKAADARWRDTKIHLKR
jgi:hypothetical protein